VVNLRWIAAVFAVLLLGAASVVLVNGYHERRASEAKVESDILKGQVETLKDQIAVSIQSADSFAAQAQVASTEKLALKAKLAKLQSLRGATAQGIDNPVGPVVSDPAPADLKDQIISAQTEVIAKQDEEITALNSEVGGLRVALDLSSRALDTSERRARGLELALDAQSHATRTSKWVGRFQGLLVGICGGYVGGKVK